MGKISEGVQTWFLAFFLIRFLTPLKAQNYFKSAMKVTLEKNRETVVRVNREISLKKLNSENFFSQGHNACPKALLWLIILDHYLFQR